MSKWVDLPEDIQGRSWLSLTDLADLNFALNALIDMKHRGVTFTAIDDDVWVELRGSVTPLVLDSFQDRPVFSIGDLL